MGGAGGSRAHGKGTPAHSDQPLAEQAALGGSASSRAIPVSCASRAFRAWQAAACKR